MKQNPDHASRLQEVTQMAGTVVYILTTHLSPFVIARNPTYIRRDCD